jgi:GTP pyrophosphokinase
MAKVGRRFREALAYAAELHEQQGRKGSEDAELPWIPYVAHLLGVASLVLEADGSEEEAIAALLHDAVEDHPRRGRTRREIGGRFGPAVLAVVLDCTKEEIVETGRPAVVAARRRMQTAGYVEHLREAPASAKLVAAADKLHNARAIVGDLRVHGKKVWQRFRKSRRETLAYYAGLVGALRGGDDRSARIVDELERTVNVMHALAARPSPRSSAAGRR